MKVLPRLPYEEREFLRDVLSGVARSEAYRRWIMKLGDDDACPLKPDEVQNKVKGLMGTERIRQNLEFLQNASAEQVMEQNYVNLMAFGNDAEALKAAKQWVETRTVGSDIADVFMQRLKEIRAEIVVPCGKEAHAVRL